MSVRVTGASFRDPSGFVFERDGVLYRQVNASYVQVYERVKQSGLYRELTGASLLIEHEEAETALALGPEAVAVLQPRRLPFISYPHEWSFGALQDAALLTLQIQRRALAKDFSLKDANATNVQFDGPRAIFIDTLSFTPYEDGAPWVAYGQFCRHFLAPLALMSRCDLRLGALQQSAIDGIALDLASRLLPRWTRFTPTLALHIHLHARAQVSHAQDNRLRQDVRHTLPRARLLTLLDSLEDAVRTLPSPSQQTSVWRDYYSSTNNYTEEGLNFKEEVVGRLLTEKATGPVWDLGANTGRFARLVPAHMPSIAFDFDPVCVDICHTEAKSRGHAKLLSLVMDLTNPSAAGGWANQERGSLVQRGPAGTALALGLVHHLAIGNNVPLARIAEFFHQICGSLVIEFVDSTDEQVKRLLWGREDIFSHYSRPGFEEAFSKWFNPCEAVQIPGMGRTLYWMQAKV